MATGYTPIYRIFKGGFDVTNRFNDRTTQIKVELASGGGSTNQMIITVDDRDWKIARPHVGDVLQLWLGYEEVGLAYMGSFELSDVIFQGPPRAIQLIGLSMGMQDVQKAPTIAEFDGKTVGDIIGQMASQTGLGVAISPALADIKIKFKNQSTSNMHLMHELERLTGAVAKVEDGKMIFISRDGTVSTTGSAIPTLVLGPEHFGTWSVRYSSKPEFGNVRASWFDGNEMVRKWVDHGVEGFKKGSGYSGSFLMGPLFNSEEEAKSAAKSKMEALVRAEATATFELAKGDPWIRDMQTLLVSGMRDGINGSWVIDKAVHTYMKRTGIQSHLECKGPGDGADYSGRADEETLKPGPGELMGEVLRDHPELLENLSPDGRDLTP